MLSPQTDPEIVLDFRNTKGDTVTKSRLTEEQIVAAVSRYLTTGQTEIVISDMLVFAYATQMKIVIRLMRVVTFGASRRIGFVRRG
jgi:hypothetical protein